MAATDSTPNPSTDAAVRTLTPRQIARSQQIDLLHTEVLNWVAEHGNARIPQKALGRPGTDGKPFALGRRVSGFRSAHRQGRVSEAEAAMFEAIPGWTWDHRLSAWFDRFDDVVSRYPDDLTQADRGWLAVQRLRLGVLGGERVTLLQSYPGLLEPAAPSKVPEFVDSVRQWLVDHPDRDASRIPYRAVQEVNGIPTEIGRRVTYYRRRYRGLEGKSKNPLTPEEIAMIESLPGWTWEASRPQQRLRN